MKKKLFTLLTLLLCLTTGAWAGQTITLFDAVDLDGKTLTSGAVVMDNSKWYGGGSAAVDGGKTISGVIWSKRIKFGGGSTFKSGSDFARVLEVTVPSAGTLNVYFLTGSNGKARYVYVSAAPSSTNRDTQTAVITESDSGDGSVASGNVAAGTYYIWCAENIGVYGVTLEKSGPTINTQPIGASYITGQTIAALTVEATASAGTLSYQWYSCGDANKTNTAAISGAISDSYTPTAAGFYYVTVTDDNGSIDSDVVEISISAASAPSFTSVTPSATSVARGTASTITAVVDGNPTPTIQWYSNTTDNNTGGTIIDGATGLTLNLDNSIVGTYYYYAVATNTTSQENNVASDVQTITVKPQAPTMTASAKFATSKNVTISKANGEAESAVIKYKEGDGEWQAYSAALNITATKTITAKVVQAGIESDEVSATYTKIDELFDQTDVTAATWDWSKYGTKEIGTASQEFYRSDILVDNVAKYDLAAPAADFGPEKTMVLNGDFIVRDSKYCQVTTAMFKTTVPGTITVEFSNTGGNRPYRYLSVNGVLTQYKSNVSNETVTTGDIAVAAGEVKLAGILDPSADDTGAGQVNFLRIYKITFAPTEVPTTVSATLASSGYTTFASPYDLSFENVEGLDAAYVVSDVSETNATLTKVTAVPAGTGVILKGTAGSELSIPVATYTGSAITNELVGVLNACTVKANSVYVISGGEFKLYTGTEIIGGKAYLPKPAGGDARALNFVFDQSETTSIEDVRVKMSDVSGDFFNLQGRRVAQPTKGLYIVNGKKVIIK